MERLTIPDEHIDGGTRRTVVDAREVKKHAMTLYWQLKKYEDTGITPEQLKIIEEEYSRMAHELAMLRKQRASVKPTKGQSLCPECGRHILRCYSFCPDCGSEIDWSEEIEQ